MIVKICPPPYLSLGVYLCMLSLHVDKTENSLRQYDLSKEINEHINSSDL